jgi:hypothetical protein
MRGMLSPRLIGTITYRLRNGQAMSDRTQEDIQLNKQLYEALLSFDRVSSHSITTSILTYIFTQPQLSHIQLSALNTPQCLPHSSRSTLPRTTRSSETTPPQLCPKRPSKRPIVVPLSLQLGHLLTMVVDGYVCQFVAHPCYVTQTWSNISQSSAAQRFGNLEALKRRQDEESMARRQSFHDAYGKPGFIGTLWNKYVLHHTTIIKIQ